MPRSAKSRPHQQQEVRYPSSKTTKIIEHQKVEFTRPVVIGSFVGPGLAGLTTGGYIIERLSLHEVAYVWSPHIPPSVVFIGGKIRHPFRIYGDKTGKVALVICEVTISKDGLLEVASELMGYLGKLNPTEVVLLDGVSVPGLPETRPTFFIAGEKRQQDLKALGMLPAESALVGGISGSILSECLIRKIPAISVLTPVSIAVVDPGAPLTLVKALNSIYGFKIATKELEEDAEAVNQKLTEISRQYRRVQEEQSSETKGPESMYG